MLGRSSEPSQEEMMEMQREMERERSEEQTAQQLASQAANQQPEAQPGYWDVLTQPDIDSQIEEYDEYLQEFLSVELSGQHTIGNISREDWESWNWRTENEFWVIKNEFQDPNSKLDDLDMAAMGYGDRPPLTDKRARRLRHAMQIRKLMTSNSIDARGQRSGTEIHAVARTEAGDSEEGDESGGGWRSWLSG